MNADNTASYLDTELPHTEAITRLLRLARGRLGTQHVFLASTQSTSDETPNTQAHCPLSAHLTGKSPQVLQDVPHNILTGVTNDKVTRLAIEPLPHLPAHMPTYLVAGFDVDEDINEQQIQALSDLAWCLADSYATTQKASQDALTGLINRHGFEILAEHVLKVAARTNNTAVLLCFDLDNFKSINEKYGQDDGDEVLRTVAKLMSDTFRESDILARLAGNTFAALLTNTTTNDAKNSLCRLEETLKASGSIHPAFSHMSFGAGIAASRVIQGESVHDLMQRAEKRMYQAKQIGPSKPGTIPGLDEKASIVGENDDEIETLL